MTSLPTIISEYLAASDRNDVDTVVACFTNDATVRDEDQDWHGHAGIRQWRTRVANAYEYTVERRGTATLGALDGIERYEVYTHLEGNFPGGTVDLTNRFGLRDDHIASIEIGPTDNTQS